MEDAEMPYNPDGDPRDKLQAAFEEKYLDSDGVVGIGMTDGDAGEPAILVYLQSAQAAEALPKTFEGMAVATEIVGDIDAYDP